MRHTVTTLLLAAGIGLAVTSASAADLGNRQVYKAPPVAPTLNWTGFYVGAHLGYGWGHSDWNDPVFGVTSVKSDGVIGGGQMGYNWQVAPNWVLGLEGDISGSGMKGSSACGLGLGTCSNDINWLATVAGRVGYSFDQVMLYGKGGAAWMDRDLTVSRLGLTSTASGSRTGWVAGAGVEWAFAPAWSAKLEYNHMDFGSENILGTSVDQTVDAVKVGVNYRFGAFGGRY